MPRASSRRHCICPPSKGAKYGEQGLLSLTANHSRSVSEASAAASLSCGLCVGPFINFCTTKRSPQSKRLINNIAFYKRPRRSILPNKSHIIHMSQQIISILMRK
jgi:hypothetical protein